MKKLEQINTEKEIAEFERKRVAQERVATKTDTMGGNQADFRVH